MIPLTAREALDPCIGRVTAAMRSSEPAQATRGADTYAVFDEETESFLGVVPERACTQFPQRIFADLLAKRQPAPVQAGTPLEAVSDQMAAEGVEALPVLDEQGTFLGIITRPSLLEALLRREQELLAETRFLHERLGAEHQRLVASAKRRDELYEASHTLLGLAGQTAVEWGGCQEALRALTTLLQARAGAIELLEEVGELQQLIVTAGSPEAGDRIEELLRGPERADVPFGEKEIVRLADLSLDPRFVRFVSHPRPVKSLLVVPIRHQDQVYGRVSLWDKTTGEPFTEADERLALSFARSIALALAHARELAERTRAEEALQLSEARFKAVVSSAKDSIFIKDRSLRYILANPTMATLFDMPVEEIVGKSDWDLFGPEVASHMEEVDRRVLAGEVVEEERAKLVRGTLFTFHTIKCPLRGPKGEVLGLCGIARDITERKQAEEALLAHTFQIEAVRAVGTEITRELDLRVLLGLIIRRATELVGATLGSVCLWNESAQVLVTKAWLGFGEWRGQMCFKLGEGVTGTVAQRREGLIVNDYRTSPCAHPLTLERTRTTMVLAEPLLCQGRLLGVIGIGREETGRPFTQQDRKILALFATEAAIAIANARLHETTVQQARQLVTLNEVSRTLTTLLDPQRVAQEILAAVQVLIPQAAGRLWEQEEDGQALRLIASIGLQNPEGGAKLQLCRGEGVMGIAAATRQSVISPDVTADPRFLNQAWAAAEGLVSAIILPLIHGEKIHGGLAIFTREPHDFSDEEVGLLQSFSAQAAIALENARLHSAAMQRGEELGALLRAGRSVMAGLDLQETLSRIVVEAAQISGSAHVKVLLVDGNAGVLRVGAVQGTAMPVDFQLPLGAGLSGLVAETGQPVFSEDAPADPRNALFAEGDRELGLVTYLGLPIKIGDDILGVLTFNSTVPRQYSPAELTYLTSFAAQAAIAIDNARLFEEVRAGRKRLQVLSRRLLDAQEAERRHIARELHDEIGQVLTAVKINLQAVERLPQGEPLVPHLREGIGIVERAIERVRNLSLNLHPSILDDLGLVAALRWHVDDLAQRAGLPGQFVADPPAMRPPPDIETACFRVAQEALTNVVRHAQARRMSVELRQRERHLELLVRDDGVGFDVDAVQQRAARGASFGLLGLQERVHLVGGQVAIESTPGRGTTIRAHFPLTLPLERRGGKRA